MIGKLSPVRHGVVAGSVLVTTFLAAGGVLGGGHHPERFDSWQTVIAPAGDDGLRVTETFDQDFGTARRHGPERMIPNDFGSPQEVVASSPDAPADVSTSDFGGETRVRIGDPDDGSITGQHRYTLAYTLPAAELWTGQLSIDALAGDEYDTSYAEVVVTGFVLDDVTCFVGEVDSTERCEIVADGSIYRATLGELPPQTGITIEGTIVGRTDPVSVPPPPIPNRRGEPNRLPFTLGMAGLGLLGTVPIYLSHRRRGRNEVFAGGAADAAFGALTPPTPGAEPAPPAPTTLIADDDLGELATIEFVPPKGLAPWEARALLTERVDDSTVEAWISGLAGREALTIGQRDDKLVISSGVRRGELDAEEAAIVSDLLGSDGEYVTGAYDPAFATVWRRIATMQRQRIEASGWWVKRGPTGAVLRMNKARWPIVLLVLVIVGQSYIRAGAPGWGGALRLWPVAIALGLLVPALVAAMAYAVMLSSRSAQGSALALRAESFRRFLHASEGKHVEWAWTHGLLREYSGWAVALDEAEAWGKALAAANVPEPARSMVGPVMLPGLRTSMRSSRTAPSSSSSGSGGRSGGGGRVGGGGGGGSRGSW